MCAKESIRGMNAIPIEGLPAPHRCPLWVQYLLASPLRKLGESPRKLVGPYVEPGMTVLDPGCGFGYMSLPMARMVGPTGKVLSVDVEARAIVRLQRRGSKAGLAERIDARACAPRDLGLSDFAGQVDLVTVIHTLHEFEDLPGFLAQVANLLKPGGKMLVVEPRGHVKPEQFAAEMACCRQAGFRELDSPDLGRGRIAALLAPPVS
ncbi:MAG: class I SAM-dependent methyltransferase [Proteobacteria bacterium]|nr:class I SAM-dependent methyltransferase [Pseudomonadota bacterium]